MQHELLNVMVMYIENHLTEKIDYKKLSKITGMNDYILQRIFLFIAGISISEYVRKRRLSKAYEELKLTDIKVIDIAQKYDYDSHISFSRAFKNEFNITPSECRKNKNNKFKAYPILTFKKESACYNDLDYEIKDEEEKVIYCKEVKDKEDRDLLYKIRRLYDNLRTNGLYEEFNKHGQYGTSIIKGEYRYYYVGCNIKYKNTKKIIIPKGSYAVFSVGTRKQKDILKTEKIIYEKWFPSVEYELGDSYYYELYMNDNCYLYIPIKKKQN